MSDETFSDAFDTATADVTDTPETAPVEATDASETPDGKDGGTVDEGVETPDPVDPEPVDAPEPEDAVLSLTQAELAEIKANPATNKLYKSLMKASTAKFQQISADKKFLDSIRTNPRAVLESAALNMGLKLVDPTTIETTEGSEAVVDDVMEDMVNLFGPDLAPQVRPVMERMVQNLVDRQVAPIKASHEQQQQESYERQATTYANTFRSRHPNISPDVESKMVEIGQQISPNEGTTPDAYLEMLHSIATAGQTASKTAKVAADRIKAAQSSAEPRRGTAPAHTAKKIDENMSLSEAFDAAWAEAQGS